MPYCAMCRRYQENIPGFYLCQVCANPIGYPIDNFIKAQSDLGLAPEFRALLDCEMLLKSHTDVSMCRIQKMLLEGK